MFGIYSQTIKTNAMPKFLPPSRNDRIFFFRKEREIESYLPESTLSAHAQSEFLKTGHRFLFKEVLQPVAKNLLLKYRRLLL